MGVKCTVLMGMSMDATVDEKKHRMMDGPYVDAVSQREHARKITMEKASSEMNVGSIALHNSR